MSGPDVFWLAFLYAAFGLFTVGTLRRYVPHQTSDDDLDLRYVGDGLLVLVWPVVVVVAAAISLLAGIGWLASHRPAAGPSDRRGRGTFTDDRCQP